MTSAKDVPMPTHDVSEARRALAAKIIDAQGYAQHGGFTRTTVFLTDVDVEVLLAALRADPARAAEKMRERAAKVAHDEAAWMPYWDGQPIRYCIAAAIRALPIQGGGE